LPDIPKDDPANHQDKLRKGADGARLRTVARRENDGDRKHHILASGIP